MHAFPTLGLEYHDDNLPKIYFDEKVVVGEGVVASSFDINPKRRFRSRLPNAAEVAELKQIVNQVVPGGGGAKDGYELLLNQMGPGNIRIITDKESAAHEIAVVAAEVSDYGVATDSVGAMQIFLGVIERDSTRHWKIQVSKVDSGCADCEGRPASYSLLGFGDFDENGYLDLLLAKSAYETRAYLTFSRSSAGWEQLE